jgi:uncharacterized protein (DUF1778 family)
MTTTEERGRITARVSLPVVEKLQEAADLTGSTLNQFLVQAALEKAERVIERDTYQRLTVRDAKMILRMLERPQGPHGALEAAFERHAREVAHGRYVRKTDEET